MFIFRMQILSILMIKLIKWKANIKEILINNNNSRNNSNNRKKNKTNIKRNKQKNLDFPNNLENWLIVYKMERVNLTISRYPSRAVQSACFPSQMNEIYRFNKFLLQMIVSLFPKKKIIKKSILFPIFFIKQT